MSNSTNPDVSYVEGGPGLEYLMHTSVQTGKTYHARIFKRVSVRDDGSFSDSDQCPQYYGMFMNAGTIQFDFWFGVPGLAKVSLEQAVAYYERLEGVDTKQNQGKGSPQNSPLHACYHRCRAVVSDWGFWIGVTLSFPLEHFLWEKVPPFSWVWALLTH